MMQRIISTVQLDAKSTYYIVQSRSLSALINEEVRRKRNEIFDKEKQRQQSLVTRVEKIEVKYIGVLEKCTLMMNKNISTPHDCAMHINEVLTKRSALAKVNGKLWDMCRPLEEDCELDFENFRIEDPFHVNKVFWRSCSFLLGLVVEKAFKDEFYVELHSWPQPDIRSGSFVYDVDLKLQNWVPKLEELRALTVMFWKLASAELNFEKLQVDASLALKMFEDNRFKREQIPDIAKVSHGNTLTLYRVGDHIDISCGPMISNTRHLGRTQISSVHPIESNSGLLYRFQGVAIPSQLYLNAFAFNILGERAKKLNTLGLENVPVKSQVVASNQQ